ncbi:MAG TPA: TonB-dependent receptor [Bacteroidales bacterium]|nr:TonB-dependent receptor [Bacteroidales bacterium]
MKVSLFLMLIGTLGTFASTGYSQETKISLKLENVTIKELFNEIGKKSEFSFWYSNRELDDKTTITLALKDKTIDEILALALRDRNLSYQIKDNVIVIYKETRPTQGMALQNIRVTGNISDASNGDPLPGVNITVEGTTTGTISDENGNYSLDVPSSNAVLIFSFVGYNTEKQVANRATIDVQLIADIKTLGEVVVVGYGVQKKVTVTGSVASIQSKDLITAKTPNISNALAGKLPGLRAVQNSGAPGDDNSAIDIRGFGSPLVIVDGVERDFRLVDANDIESISILKDASAAIYGFKGANGVILVTTKKGQKSKPTINYTTYYGIQTITRYPEMLSGYDYARLYNEAQQNIGVAASYSNDDLENFKKGIGTTDWFDKVIRKNSPQSYHNLSVSGGAEKVKYFFSFGYTNQKGIYKSDDYNFQKYNIRSNVSASVTKGLTVDLQLSGRLDKRNKPYEADPLFRSLQMAKPIFPVYANNNPEYWQSAGDKGNPLHLSSIDNVGYDLRNRREFNSSLTFNWNIPGVNGLSAKALLSYDFSNEYDNKWYKEYYEYIYNPTTSVYSVQTQHTISELTVKTTNNFKPTQQYSLNYTNTFGKHDIGGLVLWEMYNTREDWVQGYRQFTINAIDQINSGDDLNKTNNGNASETAHEGLVGRVNYAFDKKYLAEFSFRYDGTYKFDPDRRWGFFPAISLGWRLSEEDFFKVALPFVNNLKLRGSYGKVGDEGDFSAFQYVEGYNYPSGSYVLGSGGLTNGAVNKGMPNVNLTWYESRTANVGLDASLWDGLISAEFDLFVRKREGLLDTRLLTLPTTFGETLPEENLNSDETKGFELMLGHHNKIGDFTYDVKGTFSTTRESYGYVERARPTNLYDNWKNNTNDRYKSIAWGKVDIGQFQSFEEIFNSPIQDNNGNKSLLPGDIKYKDVNNDGIIDGNDDQPIGHGTTPRYYYGLNLSGQYKNFDLTLFFQGAGGHDVFVSGDLADPFIQQGLGNGLAIWNDRWHLENPADPNSKWIPGKMPALRPTGYAGNRINSTFNLQKASYLRLKRIELGYSLPAVWLKNKIESFRIFVNSENTLTFTNNNGVMKYMDPENKEGSLRYYPQMKTFNFGVNLTF